MKSRILGNSVVVAAKEQVSCDLCGEAVILDLKSGVYYGLDTVGAQIWNLIQEPQSVNEVLTTLLEEYEVELERCERDLLELLQELAAHDLIEVQDGASETTA